MSEPAVGKAGGVRAWLAGAGAFAAAFLASSHHSLHMLLLSVGMGGSALLLSARLRLGMLLVSLFMTAFGAWWLLHRPRESRLQNRAVIASLAASLALIAWTVLRDA